MYKYKSLDDAKTHLQQVMGSQVQELYNICIDNINESEQLAQFVNHSINEEDSKLLKKYIAYLQLLLQIRNVPAEGYTPIFLSVLNQSDITALLLQNYSALEYSDPAYIIQCKPKEFLQQYKKTMDFFISRNKITLQSNEKYLPLGNKIGEPSFTSTFEEFIGKEEIAAFHSNGDNYFHVVSLLSEKCNDREELRLLADEGYGRGFKEMSDISFQLYMWNTVIQNSAANYNELRSMNHSLMNSCVFNKNGNKELAQAMKVLRQLGGNYRN